MWILVGALVGAAAGAASVIITAKLRGQEVNWRDVGAAALTGAVTGAIASATFGLGIAASPITRTIAGAALGAAAGAGGTMLSNEFNGRPVWQGVRNAAIAGAVGGAIGGFALGPVAPGITPTITRTVASGAVGNGAAQATDNLLEGRPVLENVGTAVVTGGVVAGGAHVAATQLAPLAEPAGTVPRPPVPEPAGELAPAPPTTPATTADAPVAAPRGPPTAGDGVGAPQDGIVQILEKLETPQGQASGSTSETPGSNGSSSNGSSSNGSSSNNSSSNGSSSNDPATPSSELANRPLGGEGVPPATPVPGTVYEPGSPQFAQLLAELEAQGTKFTPSDVVSAAKTPDGRTVFLEKGTTDAQAQALGRKGGAGLAHIEEAHAADFAAAGVPQDAIPDLVMKALTEGNVVGTQGKGGGRPIYQVDYNGQPVRIAITTGKNGYVVGANPKSSP